MLGCASEFKAGGPHLISNLTGIIFTKRFPAGVCRSLRPSTQKVSSPNRKGEQFSAAFSKLFLNGRQPFFRKIVGWMSRKLKAQHFAALRFLLWPHEFAAETFIGNMIRVGACPGIFSQVFDVLRHGVIEEGQAVIEDGGRSDNFTRVVVSQ